MSTTKHITEVDSTWATFLTDADENTDGFISDHGMNMALYDGTNYYEWQPNRRWTGAAFEYLDGEYDDLMLYTKLSLGGSSGDPDMTITSTAGDIAISVDQNFSIATIVGGIDFTTVCGNVHIHAPTAYQVFLEGGSVKLANIAGTTHIDVGVSSGDIDLVAADDITVQAGSGSSNTLTLAGGNVSLTAQYGAAIIESPDAVWIKNTGAASGQIYMQITADGGAVYIIDETTSTKIALNVDGSAAFGGGVTVGAFGCNAATAQTAYASGGALAGYGTGAFGLDSGANMSALHALVVKIRAALVANGIMS